MKQVNGSHALSWFRCRWRATCISSFVSLGTFFFLAFAARAADDDWRTAVFPSGAAFTLEIADDAASRQRGYMFREHVGEHDGMLFVFDASDVHGFWMKNCLVSLDIIWLDERLRVVDIARNREPCPPDSECPNVYPMRIARYVLEVAAGTTQREGLKLGDQVVLVPASGGS
jgi:uncharacterized membrane protein (UPF0127 family)